MAQCPNCSLENNLTSPYCARCGAFLQGETSTLHEDGSLDYTFLSSRNAPALSSLIPTPQDSAPITPPPTMFTSQIPAPITPHPILPIPQRQARSQPRPRTFIHTLLSIIFYLIGASCFAFGTFAMLMPLMSNTKNAFILIGILIISIVILILVLIRHKTPRLRLRRLLLWIPLLTVCGFIVLFAAAAILSLMHSSNTLAEDVVFGFIVALYGLIVAVIALR